MTERVPALRLDIKGALRVAVAEITAEINASPDLFEEITDHECARRLLAHAIRDHKAGRGPWPKTTR